MTAGATHLIKVAIEAALGLRAEARRLRHRLSDAGRHLRPRLHPCQRSCAARIRWRSRICAAAARSVTFNCGYGHGYSVLEVIEAVKRVSGRNFTVITADRRPGDPAAIVADAAKIRHACSAGRRNSTISIPSSRMRSPGNANWRANRDVKARRAARLSAPSLQTASPLKAEFRRRSGLEKSADAGQGLPVSGPAGRTGRTGPKGLAPTRHLSRPMMRDRDSAESTANHGRRANCLALIRRLVTEYGVAHWPRYAVAFSLMAVAAGLHGLVRLSDGHVVNEAYVNSQLSPASCQLGLLTMVIFTVKGARDLRPVRDPVAHRQPHHRRKPAPHVRPA